jgi:hypothetical protein
MRHLWSQVWIALRWFWSFREAVAGSLSDVRLAVPSAKVVVSKEVKPSIATVCVCALLLHVEHYNMFRPVWAIFRMHPTPLKVVVVVAGEIGRSAVYMR